MTGVGKPKTSLRRIYIYIYAYIHEIFKLYSSILVGQQLF